MTTPAGEEQYGAASPARAQAFDALTQSQQGGTTQIQGILYINNKEYARSPIFTSGQGAARRNSRYALRSEMRRDDEMGKEVRMSYNDAEVPTLDWGYDKAKAAARDFKANKKGVHSVQYDLVALKNGTCNGCKVRQQKFANDMTDIFPATYSNSKNTWRVAVKPNYDNYQNLPMAPGRRDRETGQALSTYGYADAKLKSNAYTQDHHPETSDLYWQASHTPGGEAGWVAPEDAAGASYSGSRVPESDRHSPNFSSPSNSTGGTPPKSQTPQPYETPQSTDSAQGDTWEAMIANENGETQMAWLTTQFEGKLAIYNGEEGDKAGWDFAPKGTQVLNAATNEWETARKVEKGAQADTAAAQGSSSSAAPAQEKGKGKKGKRSR
ncbi:hypothetical protein F7R91_31485 [Streptomyces luteolifulvus]|uniref:Uncharacterized protein n=1 Tax=Streptomyces luteolifulvus TaxID=2615112 RepID=A0A6H9UTU8_9ACTN|nr:hypothetical protein [Streptomyces luteolifulvus]KAB1141733.1 hypothetical protein F7R91_31485 [Streptomyces luteolifulvus]